MHDLCCVTDKSADGLLSSFGQLAPCVIIGSTNDPTYHLKAWYFPERERKRTLQGGPLSKCTQSSITDRAAREANLKRIRRDGYGFSVGERDEGSYSLVAPVVGTKSEILASLSISGPVFRLSEAQKSANVQTVRKAASGISALL